MWHPNAAPVADAECGDRGVGRPASSETAAVHDGCGYSFSTGGWSDWSSRCSTSATRIRSAACVRSDGAAVADAECTNRGVGRPSTSETTGVYDGCGYEPVNWSGWSACSGGSQSSTAQCRRSDGVVVASAECDGRGMPTRRTQDCRSGPPPGLHGRYCVGGAEVARVETSRSDGYQDPYNGRGPGSNYTSGDPNHPAINCVARFESSWSEYGTYQYATSVAVYYAGSSGVSEEPYMACGSFGCDTQEAWTQ